MIIDCQNSNSSIDFESLRTQFAEDPIREPHEKETALHLEGDATRFTITTFRRTVYEKLLRRPSFEVSHLHVRDDEGQEQTVPSLKGIAGTSLTVIGVVGSIPVGAVNIGTPRDSNSHARIVK